MRWSSLVKLLLGVILAIAILMGGGVATALYFMFKVTTPPPKPIFANDTPSVKAQRSPASKTAKRTPSPAKKPSATPSSTDSSKPLEPGAYKARVTWSQGLSLRSEPNLDAERTGSAAYNQLIVVLGESTDKNWQRVRLADGEQEGWIKAGNIQKE